MDTHNPPHVASLSMEEALGFYDSNTPLFSPLCRHVIVFIVEEIQMAVLV